MYGVARPNIDKDKLKNGRKKCLEGGNLPAGDCDTTGLGNEDKAQHDNGKVHVGK